MAYASSVTSVSRIDAGRKVTTYTITETEAAATSEWSLALPDEAVTITLYEATLTAGTGTTVQPKIGLATNPTANTAGYLDQIATAAAYVRGPENIRVKSGAKTLYGRSTVDAGSDNSITTVVEVAAGHL